MLFFTQRQSNNRDFRHQKTKKKCCSQRCCFHLKREKLNKHVECAPIITKFGWLPVELQHLAGFIPGHMESPLSVPRSDSLIRPPANFGHGLTHFPWNFPTHFPSNSTKSCKIHTKITSYASYATCMVTFFWKKKTYHAKGLLRTVNRSISLVQLR